MQHIQQEQETVFDLLFETYKWHHIPDDTVSSALRWSVSPKNFVVEFNWICPNCNQPFILDNPFVTDIKYCPHCGSIQFVDWDEKREIILQQHEPYVASHRNSFIFVQNKNIGVIYEK